MQDPIDTRLSAVDQRQTGAARFQASWLRTSGRTHRPRDANLQLHGNLWRQGPKSVTPTLPSRRSLLGAGRGAAGLTIIEIVLAIGILAVGLTGLTAALLGSGVHQLYAESQTVATNHGRDLMEVLLSADETGPGPVVSMIELWTAIQGGNGLGPAATLPGEAFQVAFFDPAAPLVPLVQANMLNRWRPFVMQVTVSWTQGQRPVQVQLSSLINPRQS